MEETKVHGPPIVRTLPVQAQPPVNEGPPSEEDEKFHEMVSVQVK